jgi:hypothetical protein
MTMSEAVAYTGLSRSTVQRRVDLWQTGDRTAAALKGGRTHGTHGERRVDPVDAERARLQLAGELPGTVTPDEYLQMVRARDGS